MTDEYEYHLLMEKRISELERDVRELREKFQDDARTPEDRAVTKYIEHIIRTNRRKDAKIIKRLEDRVTELEGKG